MLLNRRKNFFTFGDFYQKAKPVSQLTLLKHRQKADIFERDPFKVQSYNFHYAERPVSQLTPNHHSQLKFFKETEVVYSNKYGMLDIRSNEKSNKTDQFFDIQRHQRTATENRPPSTRLFFCSSKASVHERSKLLSDTLSSDNQSSSRHYSELPAYDSKNRTSKATDESQFRRSSTPSPPLKRQYSGGRESISIKSPSICSCSPNRNRMEKLNAANRAKLRVRETSKAMAAAVGTVGCPTDRAASPLTATAKANEKAKKLDRILYYPDSHSFRCWRSAADTEIGCFNSASRICSNPALRKSGIQSMQHGHTLGTRRCFNDRQPQQCVQKPILRNVITDNVFSKRQNRKSGNICITINEEPERYSLNKNLIIKIESSVPKKIKNSSSLSYCTANNKQVGHKNQVSNNLNNLTTQNRTQPPLLNCNITSKGSYAEKLNKHQSKYAFSEDENILSQRVSACQRFFEREDQRLQDMEVKTRTVNELNGVPGSRISKQTNHCSPKTNDGLDKFSHLHNIYENLRQLRLSRRSGSFTAIDLKNRTSSPERLIDSRTNTEDNISRRNSTTTFTLCNLEQHNIHGPSKFRPQRSISEISVRSNVNNGSQHSNLTAKSFSHSILLG